MVEAMLQMLDEAGTYDASRLTDRSLLGERTTFFWWQDALLPESVVRSSGVPDLNRER